MSIEQTIQDNTTAIIALTQVMMKIWDQTPEPLPVPSAPAVPPVIAAVPAPAPVVVPTAAPAPTAPTVVAPAIPATAAPFTDNKGLMAYCMSKYSTLGPVKGGQIQQILIGMGHQNLNSIPAEQYGEFFTKVEAL